MTTKMNTNLGRREFLHTAAGAVAFGAFFSSVLAAGGAAGAAASTSARSAELEEVLATMEARGRRFMSVPRAGCQLLHMLVQLGRFRNVLELGTSQGYATLWLALALGKTDGKITTIDERPERVEMAKNNLSAGGVADRVTFLEGEGHALVRTLEGPFDFVFLDADKPGNFDYLETLHPKALSPVALLVARKPITMRDSMKDYLDALNENPEFESVIVSVPDGDDYSLAYRRP